MDNDLDVKQAFDEVYNAVTQISPSATTPGEAAAIIETLKEIDQVLQVLF